VSFFSYRGDAEIAEVGFFFSLSVDPPEADREGEKE